jgi:hypothetical protein
MYGFGKIIREFEQERTPRPPAGGHSPESSSNKRQANFRKSAVNTDAFSFWAPPSARDRRKVGLRRASLRYGSLLRKEQAQ